MLSTFKVNVEHFALYTSPLFSTVSSWRVCLLLLGENDKNLEFYYQSLKDHNDLSKTEIVLVDRDLQHIRVITYY